MELRDNFSLCPNDRVHFVRNIYNEGSKTYMEGEDKNGDKTKLANFEQQAVKLGLMMCYSKLPLF